MIYYEDSTIKFILKADTVCPIKLKKLLLLRKLTTTVLLRCWRIKSTKDQFSEVILN